MVTDGYESDSLSLCSDNQYQSDQIDSDIEAELYGLIHHETDTSITLNDSIGREDTSHCFYISQVTESETVKQNILDLSQVDSVGNRNVRTRVKRATPKAVSKHCENLENSNRVDSIRFSKRKSDVIADILDDIQIGDLSSAQSHQHLPISKKQKKNNLTFKSKKQLKSSRKVISKVECHSSDSDDSVIFIEPGGELERLQTNIAADNISIVSDSESSDSNTHDEFDRLNTSLPNIRIGEGTKDLWQINAADLFRTRKYSGRYHEKAVLKCTNCNQSGHTAKGCSHPKKIKCFICGGNHIASGCPNQVCRKCYSPGHGSKRCWLVSGCRYCQLCNMNGHSVNDCPDSWRRYHLTTTEKKIVKGRLLAQDRPLYCYNCGQPGHFGAVCKQRRMDSWSASTWPVVVTYKTIGLSKNNTSQFLRRHAPQSHTAPILQSEQVSSALKKKKKKKKVKQVQLNTKTKRSPAGEVNFPRSPKSIVNDSTQAPVSSRQKKKNKIMEQRKASKMRKKAILAQSKFLRAVNK